MFQYENKNILCARLVEMGKSGLENLLECVMSVCMDLPNCTIRQISPKR